MIVDTSALLAILFCEPEAQRIANAIENNPVASLPASCFLEASITLFARHGKRACGTWTCFWPIV